MKKNVAVIGCGHWGKNLVRNFAELDALKAVCDPNTKLSESFADTYGVNSSSFKTILKDKTIEGIVLAVPAPLHARMAIEAMNTGKHVYVEKPLAMNQEEAEKMIQISENNQVSLMVGHLLQYHPVFIALRSMVESEKLGSLKYIYSNRLSFGKVRSEEDVIWSFAPHDISMILSLAGILPSEIRTESTPILQSNIADTANIHMEFESGLKSHISVSWLHPHKEQKLIVIGERGMIVFDDTKEWNEKLKFYKHNVTSSEDFIGLEKEYSEYVEVQESEPLRNECQHFLDVLKGRVNPLTDGHEGLNVLKVLTAASLSAKTNKSINLSLP